MTLEAPLTLEGIRVQSTAMSAAKRAVGSFTVENWQYTAFLNAAQLASEVGVSESVVVRFAKELGFRGYPELQEMIRNLVMQEMGILGLYKGTTEQRSSTISQRIQHSLNSDIVNLTQTMNGINEVDAEAAARLLCDARQITVIGSRTSRAPASIASIYLSAVLANTSYLDNSNSDIYDRLRSLDERDVVVAFILRHYNRTTVEEVAFARERGAKVITITDSSDCPLVAYSDHMFYANVGGPSFYLSHVGTIGIVNLLLLLVATLGDADKQAESLAEMEQIYDTYYYSKPPRNRARNDGKR